MHLRLPRERTGKKGVWEGHVHTAIFKKDNQQGPTVQHRELCSMLRGSLDGRGVWRRRDKIKPSEHPGAKLLIFHIPWDKAEL